jgi:large subunit ribosomal protein L13
MKTFSTTPKDVKTQWHVIDASGKTLGRLSTEVATLLMGKHKPTYAPNINTGDFVVVINASKVKLTGNKAQQKVYHRHSNYPGGLKSVSYERMIDTNPSRVIELSVKGMVPHTRLGRSMMNRLKVYSGEVHPHQAQMERLESKETKPAKKERKRGRS